MNENIDINQITDKIIDVYETVSGEVLWQQNQVAMGMALKTALTYDSHLLPLIADHLINHFTEK